MIEKIRWFFGSIADGTMNFTAIANYILGYVYKLWANEHLMWLWGLVKGFLCKLGAFLPVLLLALAAVEICFGKKLLGVQRFIACALGGYIVGVLTVSPLINQVFLLPAYVSGIVVAIVAAILSRYIYYVLLAVASGYSVFLIFYNNPFLPFALPTVGNLVVCAIIAVVAIILTFVLRKYIEMLGTAALGGFFVTRIVIANYFDYRTWGVFVDKVWLGHLIFIGVIAIVGFIVQYKTRTRY